jgi:hypothetical protein
MKLSNTRSKNSTTQLKEFYKYSVTRLEDGAERFQDTKPRIKVNAWKYLCWDNENNCEA